MQLNLVLPNTIYLFGFVSVLFHPIAIFASYMSSSATRLPSFKEYRVLFQQTIKFLEDHPERAEVWLPALPCEQVRLSWPLLLSHSSYSYSYGPPDATEGLTCLPNTIKLVGIKLQTLSSQHPGSC